MEFEPSLPKPQFRRHSCDPIHDEWFGLAPLATPESFSEVSSISSRASLFLREKRVKESHSVRFDEFVNSISDSRVDFKEKRSLISRFFNKKKPQEEVVPEIKQEPLQPEEVKVEESFTSTESSPLLSSLHLLTDQRFAEILGKPLSKSQESITSSFHSQSSESATVNAVRTLRSESSLGGDSLLEDIERSLNINLSRTGSLAKLSLSRHGSTPKLAHVEIDIDEKLDSLGSSNSSKYLYPILHVSHGESSV